MGGDLLKGVSSNNLFGTDEFGRDIFSRTLYGARISLLVALAVGLMSLFFGIIIGIPAAYYGGILDIILMRLADVLISIPWVIFGLLVAAIMDPSVESVTIALILIYIPGFIRVVRSKALSIKQETYVIAAKSMGENDFAIMFKYIFPNSMGVILVQLTLTMSYSVLAEAGLSYLGFGTQAPTPSWGLMLSDATKYIYSAPATNYILPGLLILILVFGFNFLGDGLRDYFDPKMRTFV